MGSNSGTLEVTYSTGNVSGGTGTNIGGAVGASSGTLVNNYFLKTATINPTLNGTANAENLDQTGITTATDFAQNGTVPGDWDFNNVWTTDGDQIAPIFRALSATLEGSTVNTADTVELISSGNVLSTKPASGGMYSFFVPDNVLTSGAVIEDASQPSATTFYIAATPPPPSATIMGVNLTSNTLTVLGTGVASNSALVAAAGTQSVDYTSSLVGTSYTLATKPGVGMTITTPYVLDGSLSVEQTLTTTATGALMGNMNVTLLAANMSLAGSLTDSGIVTLDAYSNGTINASGSVQVGSFILMNGNWMQNALGGTLAPFSVTNDFEVSIGTSFLRVENGNGTSMAYQLTDVYGLQGVGADTATISYLNDDFVLNNNIDATSTTNWNNNAGFINIRTGSYNGNFNGKGYTISGLTINSPGQTDAGLFSATGSKAVLENIGLVDETVNGLTDVGGLVGLSNGLTIQNCSTTGTVSGNNDVGGLVDSPIPRCPCGELFLLSGRNREPRWNGCGWTGGRQLLFHRRKFRRR